MLKCEICKKEVDTLFPSPYSHKNLCLECTEKEEEVQKILRQKPEKEEQELEELRKKQRRIYELIELYKEAERGEITETLMRIWNAINIKTVTVNRGQSENYYVFDLGEGTITLNEQECLDSKKFRMEYQKIYGIVLPPIHQGKWACLLTEWLKHRRQGKDIEELSENQEVIDAVLEYITSSRIVKGDLKETFGVVYLKDGNIWVSSKIIKKIVADVERNIKLRKVSEILKPYLATPTTARKTKEGWIRFWVFKADAVGVDITEAVEEQEEAVENE